MRLLPSVAPLLVALLVTTGLAAQAPLRVRITGVDAYRIDDILRIDGNEIRGTGILSIAGDFVEVRLPESGIVTIPKPGRRVAGRALAADRTMITLVPENGSTTIRVPVDAVARLEVGRGGGSRGRAIAWGIAAGVGGFYAGGFLGFAACGNLDCESAILIGGLAGGIGLGGLVGSRVGGERWDDVPASQLADRFPK